MEPQTSFLPKNYILSLFLYLKADKLNPYSFNFAIIERQYNAFDKSVRNAPNDFLLLVADFHFPGIDTRQH